MIDFKEIASLVLRQKKLFFAGQLLALMAVVVSVPTPLLMPLLVDEVLLHKPGRLLQFIDHTLGSGSPLYYIGVVLFVTLFLRAAFVILQNIQIKIFQTISKEIAFSIRNRVLDHLKKVSLEAYELQGSGAVVARLINDINTIENFLSSGVSRLLISILTLLGISIVLLMIHWQLALFIILLNPLVVLFSSLLARKVAKLKKEENLSLEIFQNALTETLELFEQIRAANKEERFFKKLYSLTQDIKQRSIDFAYKSEANAKYSFLIFVSGFELFRAAGIFTVAYSDLSIGLMMAIFGYLWFMMTPIQDLINIVYTKKSAEVALKRINELLQLPQEPNFEKKSDPFSTEPVEISLQNLTFYYTKDRIVLKDLNFTIPAGRISAIVGASGSGKTTLSRLLVGFYIPKEGEIFYNGVSCKEIGLETIRKNVLLVLQTPVLFNDTIEFNITLGNSYSQEKIEKVLKQVHLHRLTSSLPEGLQTVVGKGGVRLSGGERQRIALARMVLQDPKVVILDEATSAIDMETERLIFCNLKTFFQNRTTILIAHRPSTIEEADEIFLLDKGELKIHDDFHKFKENIEKNLCILHNENQKKDER